MGKEVLEKYSTSLQCKSIQTVHTQDNLLYSTELRERFFANLSQSRYVHLVKKQLQVLLSKHYSIRKMTVSTERGNDELMTEY
jgi:hypothetical protein